MFYQMFRFRLICKFVTIYFVAMISSPILLSDVDADDYNATVLWN